MSSWGKLWVLSRFKVLSSDKQVCTALPIRRSRAKDAAITAQTAILLYRLKVWYLIYGHCKSIKFLCYKACTYRVIHINCLTFISWNDIFLHPFPPQHHWAVISDTRNGEIIEKFCFKYFSIWVSNLKIGENRTGQYWLILHNKFKCLESEVIFQL